MRMIGILKTEYEVQRFCSYLEEKGIQTHTDPTFDSQSGHIDYQIWVLEEDKIQEALQDFAKFLEEPSSALFDPRLKEPMNIEDLEDEDQEVEAQEKEPSQRAKSPLTFFLFVVCAAIFFLNYLQEIELKKENLSDTFLFTPVERVLLYDVPLPIEKVEMLIEKLRGQEASKISDLSSLVSQEMEVAEKTPYFRGLVDWAILKIQKKDSRFAEGPLWIKIREGELWRLFSPAILHTQFFHILFNMIWLWLLGKPIEQKIGAVRSFFLIATIAVGSNTIQYLLGGPFFLGYSGVVMGLAGFIWMRERFFPWEGYRVHKMTFLFLALFVTALFCLSFFSFVLESWAQTKIAPNIANAAHIAGGTIGAFLGRLHWFSRSLYHEE